MRLRRATDEDQSMDTIGARHLAARLRAGVPVGTTIVLECDSAEAGLQAGDRGIVEEITPEGVVVEWERGFSLEIDPDADAVPRARGRLSPRAAPARRLTFAASLRVGEGFGLLTAWPPVRTPKSIVTTQVDSPPNGPPAEGACIEAIPTSRQVGSSMLRRCSGECEPRLDGGRRRRTAPVRR